MGLNISCVGKINLKRNVDSDQPILVSCVSIRSPSQFQDMQWLGIPWKDQRSNFIAAIKTVGKLLRNTLAFLVNLLVQGRSLSLSIQYFPSCIFSVCLYVFMSPSKLSCRGQCAKNKVLECSLVITGGHNKMSLYTCGWSSAFTFLAAFKRHFYGRIINFYYQVSVGN